MTYRLARIAALTAAAGLFAACGTTEEPSADDGPTPEPSIATAGPVTVTDARGEEITLDAPAENVVALEWAEVESLVTLGVMPAGVADVEGYSTWVGEAPLDDGVTDVGTRQEPSVDSIVALEPDLVITEERGNNLISQLEEYVPVMVIEGSDTADNIGRMRENFTTIATAVGKEDEASTVLDEFDTTLDEGRQAIEDAGASEQGFAMADGWMQGSSVAIRMFGEGSLVSDLAEEVGLENAWTAEVDEEWGLGQTDVEGLTGLGDVHLFYSASREDVFVDGLEGNAIWESLPAVENGNVHKLDAGTWTFGGPQSSMHIVDQLVAALTS